VHTWLAAAAQLMSRSSLSHASPSNCAVQRYPYFMTLFVLVNSFCIRSGVVWSIRGVRRANLLSSMNMERNWINLIHW